MNTYIYLVLSKKLHGIVPSPGQHCCEGLLQDDSGHGWLVDSIVMQERVRITSVDFCHPDVFLLPRKRYIVCQRNL